jgi:hypothetical protein
MASRSSAGARSVSLSRPRALRLAPFRRDHAEFIAMSTHSQTRSHRPVQPGPECIEDGKPCSPPNPGRRAPRPLAMLPATLSLPLPLAPTPQATGSGCFTVAFTATSTGTPTTNADAYISLETALPDCCRHHWDAHDVLFYNKYEWFPRGANMNLEYE